jgi:hypothetical protein
MRTCPPLAEHWQEWGRVMWKEDGFFPHRLNPISVMSESVLIRVPLLLSVLCASAVNPGFRERLSFETKLG